MPHQSALQCKLAAGAPTCLSLQASFCKQGAATSPLAGGPVSSRGLPTFWCTKKSCPVSSTALTCRKPNWKPPCDSASAMASAFLQNSRQRMRRACQALKARSIRASRRTLQRCLTACQEGVVRARADSAGHRQQSSHPCRNSVRTSTPVEERAVVARGARHLQHAYAQAHPQPRNDLGGGHHAGLHAMPLLELLQRWQRGGRRGKCQERRLKPAPGVTPGRACGWGRCVLGGGTCQADPAPYPRPPMK